MPTTALISQTCAEANQSSLDVLVVENREIVREGLVACLHRPPSNHVVGQEADAVAAVDVVARCRPGVVLLSADVRGRSETLSRSCSEGADAATELSLANGDVFELVTHLRSACAPLQVVLMVSGVSPILERRAAAVGVGGIVSLHDSIGTVLEAISAVSEGRRYYSRWVLDRLFSKDANADSPEIIRMKRLTPREVQVLGYLVSARTVKETAMLLGLAVNTVDNHKTRLMKKLDVHSCVELTRLAIRTGMVSV